MSFESPSLKWICVTSNWRIPPLHSLSSLPERIQFEGRAKSHEISGRPGFVKFLKLDAATSPSSLCPPPVLITNEQRACTVFTCMFAAPYLVVAFLECPTVSRDGDKFSRTKQLLLIPQTTFLYRVRAINVTRKGRIGRAE